MKTIVSAFARVRRHFMLPVVSATWAILLPFVALWPFSGVVGSLIDSRPAAERMVSGDDHLLFELVSRHPELPQLLLVGMALALLLCCPGSWLIDGAAAHFLHGRPPPRGPEVTGRKSWFLWPRMLSLGLFGLLLRLGLLAGVAAVLAASGLTKRPTFGAALQPIAGGLLLVFMAGALIELFIHHARVRSIIQPEAKFGAVLFEAGWQLRRRPAASAGWTLVGAIGFVLPTASYYFGERFLSVDPAMSNWNFAVLFIARAVTALLRATVSMVVLAAVTEDSRR